LIPKSDLKKHLFLIIAVVFCFVGALLVIASMDDQPGPPQKKLIVPIGFSANLLTEKTSPKAQLFIKTCAQCHDLPSPASHTAKEWPDVVARMVNRLRRMKFFSSRASFVPEKKSIDQIIDYLSQHALQEGDATTIDNTSPEGALFQKKCTQCHGLPSPTQHTASEWGAVVEQMRGNIERMQKEPITDQEKDTLIRYLADRSKS
jgi:cytochrome c5